VPDTCPEEDMMTVRAVATASVITLVGVTGADGRLFRVAPGTEIIVRGVPTAAARLAPGTNVIIRGGQEVEYRDGQYVLIPE
jgi:hypothetical protein